MQYTFLEKKNFLKKELFFWQSPSWYDILEASGQAREVFYFGNREGTYLLIEIRSLGLGVFGAFSMGIGANQIQEDIIDFTQNLRKELRKKHVIFLQIEPLEGQFPQVPKLRKNVYKAFLCPYTRVLDLRPSCEEILAQMHSKGRYRIGLAERRGVSVQCVEHTQENIDIWMSLLDDTFTRDGFAINTKKYYTFFLKSLGSAGRLYFAFWKGKVIAGGIFVFQGNQAIYYYGASLSDVEARKQMAPYALQWRAIQDAKEQGCQIYDFLGVADPNDPNDPLVGVSQFKERFGGEVRALPEKYIISFSKKTRWFFWFRRINFYLKKIKRYFR